MYDDVIAYISITIMAVLAGVNDSFVACGFAPKTSRRAHNGYSHAIHGESRKLKLTEDPHRRRNPLTNEWVLVSPHRATRPWLGQIEKPAPLAAVRYDPTCYLCPGNPRSGGVKNPPYAGTFVFDNDFAALKPDTAKDRLDVRDKSLLMAEGEPGICRVICFSPRHDLTLSSMTLAEIEAVVRTWTEQFQQLSARAEIHHVQIFENRGAMMGASNPHPHCQIWATASLPDVPAKELLGQQHYLHTHGSCLLCDYLGLEEQQQQRVIYGNHGFVAVVPFWATWPFEILILSRRHVASLEQLSPAESTALATILKQVTTTYDRVFDAPFPYSMGFHQAPSGDQQHPEWHFHAHFYPPLLRSATVRKFMVGFELLGNPQRDITPEVAAERLRELCANGS